MRWKSDSEVWNGYGSIVQNQPSDFPDTCHTRNMVCTIPMERTSVPYLLEGMERAWFHTYGTGLVPYPGTHESPGVCTIPFEKKSLQGFQKWKKQKLEKGYYES